MPKIWNSLPHSVAMIRLMELLAKLTSIDLTVPDATETNVRLRLGQSGQRRELRKNSIQVIIATECGNESSCALRIASTAADPIRPLAPRTATLAS